MTQRNVAVQKTSLSEQGSVSDLHDTTAAERIGIRWQLALDTWAFKGEPVAESRPPRHTVRVERREG